jgi:acylphosphatase
MTARRAIEARIEGRVQGVGFRAWTERQAISLDLDGWVRNEPDGSVRAVLAGNPQAVDLMVERLRRGPPAARVTRLDVRECDADIVPPGFDVHF